MKINVEKLRSIPGKKIKVEFLKALGKIKFEDVELHFVEDLKISVEVKNTGSEIVISGEIDAVLNQVCGRCLTDTRHPVNINFEERFIHESKVNEKTQSEDEVKVFSGDEIDLEETILQNILINLPISIVCHEQCKGICSYCGTDLNKTPCSCTEDNIDPRMEVLKKLIKDR